MQKAFTEIFVWGSNTQGQLGLKQCEQVADPKHCSFNIIISSISCGRSHTVFVSDSGSLYTMGSNIQGCLGIGSFTPSFTTTPTLVSLPFAAVKAACGESHTIALTRNGKIYSWGEVSCLGYKARESQPSPQQIKIAAEFKDIASGSGHSLALTKNSSLYGWGNTHDGQLGLWQAQCVQTPVTISLESRVDKIFCGINCSFVVDVYGRLYSTGLNRFGELGTGDKNQRYSFGRVQGLEDIKQVASSNLTIAVNYIGQVFVWGSGFFGEQLMPVQFDEVPAISGVSVGVDFIVLVDSKGQVWNWGCNNKGQLGQSDFLQRIYPTQVQSLNGKIIQTVVCGEDYSIGIGLTKGTLSKYKSSGVMQQRKLNFSPIHKRRSKSPKRHAASPSFSSPSKIKVIPQKSPKRRKKSKSPSRKNPFLSRNSSTFNKSFESSQSPLRSPKILNKTFTVKHKMPKIKGILKNTDRSSKTGTPTQRNYPQQNRLRKRSRSPISQNTSRPQTPRRQMHKKNHDSKWIDKLSNEIKNLSQTLQQPKSLNQVVQLEEQLNVQKMHTQALEEENLRLKEKLAAQKPNNELQECYKLIQEQSDQIQQLSNKLTGYEEQVNQITSHNERLKSCLEEAVLKNKELFRALDLNLKRKAMDYKDRTINLLANRKNQDSFESDRVVFRQLNDTR